MGHQGRTDSKIIEMTVWADSEAEAAVEVTSEVEAGETSEAEVAEAT